jgi:mannose-6-phosphate isomerase-like protein (cupin superfamily)
MVQEVNAVTDNAAVLQQRVTKGSNQFLATLAEPGESQFLTVLKPCSILLPHTHQRANEFYSVIFGIMDAGIAQENGAAQDITFDVNPGEVFVVPQGLLHHNHNAQCTPNVFLQSFTSSDPGALNVIGALAAMGAGSDAGAAAIAASGAELVEASPEGAFALDQACLKRCGFPATGAPGDGLADLPDEFRALFGLPAGKKA